MSIPRFDPLWRVSGLALVIAGISNALLWRLVDDDAFATTIAVASLVTAVGLIVTHYVQAWGKWMGEVLLATMAVWLANLFEFALEDNARWESQVRSCGFYASFALIALGMYLATRRVDAHGH